MEKSAFFNFILYGFVFLFIVNCVASSEKFHVPPNSESKTPQNIIEYFCKKWTNANYASMYGALSSDVRDKISFEDFKKSYKSEQKIKGLPDSYKIINVLQDQGNKSLWSVQITYTNTRIQPLTKQVWCEKESKNIWRISDGIFANPSAGYSFIQ